jgi:hypothetical protein
MEVLRAPTSFTNKSCELPQGCLGALETFSCLRSQSIFGTHCPTYSWKHKNLQREACEAVLEGLQSSYSLTKLQPLLWENHTGYGGWA